jgi:sorting nexin-13
LELFRANQAKIEKKHSGLLTIEHREMELRRILANENKLHPALFSAEAEHKVVYLLAFFFALQIMLKSLICRSYVGRLMYCFLIFCLFKCGYDAFCTFCFQVLQHLMDGLVSFTFRPEDLQCFFFRYMARELLASTVMRPVLNMASPRCVLLPDLLLCFIMCSSFHCFSSIYFLAGLSMKKLNS